jgi:hypothetical protein
LKITIGILLLLLPRVVSEKGEQCIENVFIKKIEPEDIAECANNDGSHYKYF